MDEEEGAKLEGKEDLLESNNFDEIGSEKKKKKKKKKKGKKKKDGGKDKKSNISSDRFMINNIYSIVKMLGFGAFGEIHLAYDMNLKVLRAIKFEPTAHKNPQLKHEYTVLEQLNKAENIVNISQEPIVGIPKVYYFDRHENKYNYLVMDLLGPSLSDLFQLKEKNFSLETVLLIGIQMISRIEFIHEKGFLHRDIKPENFVIGLGQKSNLIHIIDFGLSKRYKDKATGQHIPYRENKDLVGTVRYASINAHLGIEQSRRDDIEGIGYVLVYFYLGRLPWQGKQDKGKPQVSKIMEKKLITPPEILCKKMPVEFSYYFHYCRNLKFEDRPDYNMIKGLFLDLLSSRVNLKEEILFDWFDENSSYKEKKRLELNWAESGRAGDMKEDKRMKNGMNLIEEKDESKEESNIHNIINNKNDGIANKQKDILEDLLKGDHKDIEEKHEHDQEGDKIIEEKNSKGSSSYKVVNKEE